MVSNEFFNFISNMFANLKNNAIVFDDINVIIADNLA